VGLVYARSVFESHGGSITLQDCEDGGMDAVIRLPR
jgi:signal transduction histidine kinase